MKWGTAVGGDLVAPGTIDLTRALLLRMSDDRLRAADFATRYHLLRRLAQGRHDVDDLLLGLRLVHDALESRGLTPDTSQPPLLF